MNKLKSEVNSSWCLLTRN